jgi:hypothetical protein
VVDKTWENTVLKLLGRECAVLSIPRRESRDWVFIFLASNTGVSPQTSRCTYIGVKIMGGLGSGVSNAG